MSKTTQTFAAHGHTCAIEQADCHRGTGGAVTGYVSGEAVISLPPSRDTLQRVMTRVLEHARTAPHPAEQLSPARTAQLQRELAQLREQLAAVLDAE